MFVIKKIIDLTLAIEEHWKFNVRFRISKSIDLGDDYNNREFTLNSHSYTHIDAPAHFNNQSKYLDEFNIQDYAITEALILNLSYVKNNQKINADMLNKANSAFLNKHFETLIIKTCWGNKISINSKEFWSESPYLTEDAVDWICLYKPKIVAFDFPYEKSKNYIAHRRILVESEILIIEYITNLEMINTPVCTFVVLPLKLKNADGAQIRCIAITEDTYY